MYSEFPGDDVTTKTSRPPRYIWGRSKTFVDFICIMSKSSNLRVTICQVLHTKFSKIPGDNVVTRVYWPPGTSEAFWAIHSWSATPKPPEIIISAQSTLNLIKFLKMRSSPRCNDPQVHLRHFGRYIISSATVKTPRVTIFRAFEAESYDLPVDDVVTRSYWPPGTSETFLADLCVISEPKNP